MGAFDDLIPQGGAGTFDDLIPQAEEEKRGGGVAKAAVSGATKGVFGMAGMGGDVRDLIDAGLMKLGFSAETAADIRGKALRPIPGGAALGPALDLAPTSRELKETVKEALPGSAAAEMLDYVPQGTAEEYASTLGEFAPGMLVPGGSVAQKAAGVVLPALASETAGQAARRFVPSLEGPARLLGAVGGGLAASRVRGPQTNQPAMQRQAQAEEFGIPLTRGEAAADISQQATEQAMRNAAKGPAAAQEMQAFDARRAAAMQAAKGEIASGLGGVPEAPAQAAITVRQGLQGEAERLRAAGDVGFEMAAAKPARVGVEAMRDLPTQVNRSLADVGIELGPHVGGYEGTRQALNRLNRIARPSVGEGATVTEVSLKSLNEARKTINNIKAANAADGNALGIIRDRFDDFIKDAVEGPLFRGDKTALDDLLGARDLWARYRQLTRPRVGGPNADAEARVAEIIGKERTPIEVANYLFGSARIEGQGRAARIAGIIRDKLGADSEAFQQLRQAAWSRMSEPSVGKGGAQALASSIRKQVEGPLAKALFTPGEIAKFRRFGDAAQLTVPLPQATNPSKSGYEIGRIVNRLAPSALTAAGTYLGAKLGGPVGAMVGPVVGAAGKYVGNVRQGLKAAQAVQPTVPVFSRAGMLRSLSRLYPGLTAGD